MAVANARYGPYVPARSLCASGREGFLCPLNGLEWTYPWKVLLRGLIDRGLSTDQQYLFGIRQQIPLASSSNQTSTILRSKP